MHLIMESVQPEGDGPAWRAPIIDGRHEIWLNLEDSPSLRGHLETHLADTYVDAVKDAIYVLNLPPSKAAEIPRECPYTLDQLLGELPRI